MATSSDEYDLPANLFAAGEAAMKTKRKIPVREGGRNIFADLGFPNAEREQLKAHLTARIYGLIKQRGLTQAQTGKVLGIKEPHVSALMRGYSVALSVERLMDFLTALGRDVEIAVTPARREHRGDLRR